MEKSYGFLFLKVESRLKFKGKKSYTSKMHGNAPRIDFRVLDEQFLPKGAKVPRFG